MLKRITRSVVAPLALLLVSVAAPPSRADFALYVANGGNTSYPAALEVTSGGGGSTLVSPGVQSYGVATDSNGDVFLTENSKIVEITSSGTSTIYSDSSSLQALGRDSQGNLFVTYVSKNGIQEISGLNVSTFSSSYGYAAHGIAIDSTGDVFLTDDYNNRVVKLDSSGSRVSGFSLNLADAWGVAIDPISHNLFVSSDSYAAGVREYNPTTGAYIRTFSGFLNARGLAFDSSGNLFVGDYNDGGGGKIYEISAANVLAGNSTKTTFASGNGLYQPDALAIYEPQALSAVPEPSSLTLLGLGLASLAAYCWRRRRRRRMQLRAIG